MKIALAQTCHATQEAEWLPLVKARSEVCEFCGADQDLALLHVLPVRAASAEKSLLTCPVCSAQLTGSAELDPIHWRCLHEAIWSESTAVQVTAWRLLRQLRSEPWAEELLEQLYLDEAALAWAQLLETETAGEEDAPVATKDSNGTALNAGDSVTLIKDLDVKGAGFVAKRGTVVKNIALTGNPEHIEGRVNGVQLVLKTCFLKKAN